MTAETDPLGHVTTYSYDAQGRQTAVEAPSGGVTTTQYDSNNQVTAVTDPLGHTTTYAYDSQGNQTVVINPLSKTTTMTYDQNNHETSLTDPDGNVTTFAYNFLQEETLTTNPLGFKTTTTYNNNEQVSTVTDPLGQEEIYSYDSAGRNTSVVWKNSSGTTVNTLTYMYDESGNMLTAANAAGTYTMGYDSDNREKSVSGLFGVSLTYGYDAVGNQTSAQDSLGGTTTTVYNGNNEWTTIEDNGTGMSPMLIQRSYNADNLKSGDTRYNFPDLIRINFMKLLLLFFSIFMIGYYSSVPYDRLGNNRTLINSIGMEFVFVPNGSYNMGSSSKELEENSIEYENWYGKKTDPMTNRVEEFQPEHQVKISNGFYMGITEVTQKEYCNIKKNNPSYFSSTGNGKKIVHGLNTDNFPVDQVTWFDAIDFCEKLSQLQDEKTKNRKYRLPTEAEWEYACRGGAKEKKPYFFGPPMSSKYANYNGKKPNDNPSSGPYLGRPCNVGSYRPNSFGLYDMHGNVYEWCSDYYGGHYYKDSPENDPTGPDEGVLKVFRGGSWTSRESLCRSSFRHAMRPNKANEYIGFRVILIEN